MDQVPQTFMPGEEATPSRSHSSTPSRLEYYSEQVMPMNMLQSMSVALSEIQAQLSTVQQQYAKQDEQLKMIQNTIKANQEKPTTNVV